MVLECPNCGSGDIITVELGETWEELECEECSCTWEESDDDG